jgi:glutathione S-transferase
MQAGIFAMASARMRKAMTSFGVTAESIPAIEASYAEFLRLLDSHLASSPYLLGGRPTIADYGLIAPLYAHLARDPYPARLMQQTAHRVWRWTERMNRADQDAGEYGDVPEALFADDHVPDTLMALLRFVAEDYLPEIRAYVQYANEWLSARPEIVSGTNGLARTQDRVIGTTTFTWRGHPVQVAVMPYRLYLLQKIQEVADQATPDGRANINRLLADTGLSEVLTLRTQRRILRSNHLEVWSEPLLLPETGG